MVLHAAFIRLWDRVGDRLMKLHQSDEYYQSYGAHYRHLHGIVSRIKIVESNEAHREGWAACEIDEMDFLKGRAGS